MKRTTAWILALILLLMPIFSACSDTPVEEETNGTATASDSADKPVSEDGTESVAEEAELIDQVEEKDYEGYEFNYLALATGVNGTTRFVDEMWVEDVSPEVILNATWTRNLFISDRLNVEIAVTPVADPAVTLRQAVISGDNGYDMAGAYKLPSTTICLEGLTRDWNTLDIDYTQPWWSRGAREQLQVKNYLFMMSGNILISEIDDILSMCYNKDLIADYNLEDIYTVVREGRWTIDKFIDMTSAVSGDLNGDSQMKVGVDLYGYVQDPISMTNNWFFSSDLMHTGVDADGVFSFNVDAERVQGMLDKLSPFFETDNIYSGLDLYVGLDYFQENKIFVYAIILRNLELLREMEVDFGVIPYPMYDEAQGHYVTHVGIGSPILTIPLINTDNDERLADILEAMAISSRQYLLPAYYETALKDKIARDPETAEMLDIIVESKEYDLSYLLGSSLIDTGAGLITKGSTNFASSWAKSASRNEKIVQKSVDKLIEAGEKQALD